MTTVVGIVLEAGAVVMAADGCSDLGGYALPGAMKVRAHPIAGAGGQRVALVGCAGAASLGALAAARWHIDEAPEPGCCDDEADAWAAACAQALADLAASASPSVLEDGCPNHLDGVLLLGALGRLWVLSNHDAHPLYRAGHHYAIGSGSSVALGYLDAASSPTDTWSTARMVAAGAVQAAARYDSTTNLDRRGPLVLAVDRGGALLA